MLTCSREVQHVLCININNNNKIRVKCGGVLTEVFPAELVSSNGVLLTPRFRASIEISIDYACSNARTAGRQRHSFVVGHPEWIRSGAKWSPTTCFCQPQDLSSAQKFLNFSSAFECAAFLHNVCDKLGGFSALTQIFQLLLAAFASGCGRYLKRYSKQRCQVYKYTSLIPRNVQHFSHKSSQLWSRPTSSDNIKLKSLNM